MQLFEQMSWGEAVSFVRTVGVLMNLLFLSIPIAAWFAIRRGRRNRPDARLLFPRVVFWGWFVLLAASVVYFISGAWYSESGPPPQTAAAQSALALACYTLVTVAIYIGLYKTTGPQEGSSAA
jgi:hypothetical protein